MFLITILAQSICNVYLICDLTSGGRISSPFIANAMWTHWNVLSKNVNNQTLTEV